MRVITDPEEAREAFRPWREQHARPAWRPVTQPGEGDVAASRFGGRPALMPGEAWPKCLACGSPQTLFLQLDLDDLPEGSPDFGGGLLQFFYCVFSDEKPGGFICEVENEGWERGSKCHLFRVLRERDGLLFPLASGGSTVEARVITDWSLADEMPGHDDLISFGYSTRDVPGAKDRMRLTVPDESVGFEAEHDRFDPVLGEALQGDKLGGWPLWIQGERWSNCPICGRRLWVMFQLDSYENLGNTGFGDSGCGTIMQCPEHLDVMNFGWDCC